MLSGALPATLLVVALLGSAGCGGDGDVTTAGPAARSGTPSLSAPTTEPGGYNATDRGWAQLMAPMNERTLLLLDLVAERTADPGLSDLARRTEVTHRDELTRLRGLLRKTGAAGTNPHEGHDMKGMVTDDELRSVAESRGKAFDALAMTYLREHLEQGILVSRGEEDSGAAPAATGLAREVGERRAGQLKALRLLGG
ncbi:MULTISPECIES: DUF305 domain-containing protein [unclassified Streptomyces]|uniref:DUF305 domain-containing protein n=1 Tax=unclassified Streptomyces TaxID=2593676 RepID=UPI00136B6735|nr:MULTISPECIES: DUF305 domain-containing protein [unclassified Streptomyces]MYZ38190.1 DUF305 domain-containing protein [Streptomyces sp. SID4917]